MSGAVSASLGSVSPIICLPSFVSHVLCQGLCPPPWALCLPSVPKQFTVGVLNSLSSGVRLCSDGGVWLSGCPEFICLPLYQLICLPIWLVVSGFGCLQFICLALWQLICLPVWLVVSGSSAVSVTLVMSGSLAVSNSFVSGLWQFICLPVWLVVSGFLCCLLSPIHLSSLVAIDLSPSLAGGVRLSGCLQVICFPLWLFNCFSSNNFLLGFSILS